MLLLLRFVKKGIFPREKSMYRNALIIKTVGGPVMSSYAVFNAHSTRKETNLQDTLDWVKKKKCFLKILQHLLLIVKYHIKDLIFLLKDHHYYQEYPLR